MNLQHFIFVTNYLLLELFGMFDEINNRQQIIIFSNLTS